MTGTKAKFAISLAKEGMDYTINHTNRRGHWIEGRRKYTLDELRQLRDALSVALLSKGER